MKILILDLESAPKKAYVWQFWKANIGTNQLLGYGYLMSAAYKWLGDDEVHYLESRTEDDSELVYELSRVLNEADIVIAHNAKKFDMPLLRARAVINRIEPWSPVKVIDTLFDAKKEFRFDRNTLEYLALIFGVEEKLKHKNFPGFELWAECIAGNEEAWKEMKEYNIQDVVTLEQVYLRMRPWLSGHPNVGVYEDKEEHVCPKCGSVHVHKRGFYFTNVGKYQRYRCTDCGGWSRSRYTEKPLEARKNLLANAI